ncbi:unnamed protein product [Polarella glacialis]|uniref:Uncharacterized protein n=1 Tax=Polarella glacialis TaxID=89957 RepID=A0A813L9N4_POLGL|nr:unnamed protein product [Polarella glacialis]
MVVPLGPTAQIQDAPAPAVVKESHAKYWWGLDVLLVLLALLQVFAGDGFGMLFTLALAGVVHHMVRDRCENMSMYCLLVFGLMTCFQGLFGLLTLFSAVGGRTSSSTTMSSLGQGSMSYTTTVQTHPFFDRAAGTNYNLQSGLLIAAPAAMLLCSLMSWWSYKAYPESLFADFDEEEAGQVYGRPQAPGYGGASGGTPAVGRPSGGVARAFEGTGQRLGS